jgi:hypothetical protein
MNENITIDIVEDNSKNDDLDSCNHVDLTKILIDIDNTILQATENNNNEIFLPHYLNYQMNYTVKQLLLICEYYGITKNNKLTKCNKDQLIQHLLIFENNHENTEIVFKRQNAWFYMNELKNDKIMKKYIIW